jgi:hypothetical protein
MYHLALKFSPLRPPLRDVGLLDSAIDAESEKATARPKKSHRQAASSGSRWAKQSSQKHVPAEAGMAFPVLGKNSAKTNKAKQIFVGQPRNVCLGQPPLRSVNQSVSDFDFWGIPCSARGSSEYFHPFRCLSVVVGALPNLSYFNGLHAYTCLGAAPCLLTGPCLGVHQSVDPEQEDSSDAAPDSPFDRCRCRKLADLECTTMATASI